MLQSIIIEYSMCCFLVLLIGDKEKNMLSLQVKCCCLSPFAYLIREENTTLSPKNAGL